MSEFVNLHCHSDNSLLDGASSPAKYAKRAKELGMPALATTDHGNVHSWLDHYEACQENGIKAIFGSEMYQARKTRWDTDEEERSGKTNDELTERGPFHLTVLARNEIGYKNLIKLSSRAYTEGYFGKPRMDYELLEEHSDGLIILSGCLSGVVCRAILRDEVSKAKEYAAKLRDIVGKENFFIEVMDHGITEEHIVLPFLLDIAKSIGVPAVPTGDCLVGESLVETVERGVVPIRDIKIGESVITDRGRSQIVSNKFERKLRQTDDGVFEVKTTIGSHAFRATGNHKVLATQSAKWLGEKWTRALPHISAKWVKVKDLTKGDSLLIPKNGYQFPQQGDEILDLLQFFPNIPSIPGSVSCELHHDEEGFLSSARGFGSKATVRVPSKLSIDKEFLFMLGFYIGNGTSDKSSYKVGFSASEEKRDYLIRISKYFNQFGITSSIVKSSENGITLDFSSRVFNKVLPTLCGRLSGIKKFPREISLDERQFAQCVFGWFSSDGHDDVKREKFSVTTTSRNLAFDFVSRMKTLGILCYPNLVKSRDINWNDSWEIELSYSRYEAIKEMFSGNLPTETVSSKVWKDFGEYWAITINAIHEIDYDDLVYDLTVEEDHSYTANLFAVSNSHYSLKTDSDLHNRFLCVSTKGVLSDPDRFRFVEEEFHLKSYDEMLERFSPELIKNTLLVSDMIEEIHPELDTYKFPPFPLPEGIAADELFVEKVQEGILFRYGNSPSEEVRKRLDHELRVIREAGFQSYFLIVADIIDHARSIGIRVGPGRGSVAGAVTAFCMRITGLDPIEHDLSFDRFLVEGRKSMPDIDIDIDDRYRDKIFDYVRTKYGADSVANVATFAKMKARSALKDTARMLEMPFEEASAIADLVPPAVMGVEKTFDECMQTDKFREAYNKDPLAKQVIDMARGLEGLTRSTGIHAAAAVITDGPIIDYVPVMQRRNKNEVGPVVTQWDKDWIDRNGLLKIDFLGLRNLGVIQHAIDLIKDRHGIEIDTDNLDRTDDETYRTIREGNVKGIFQIENPGLQQMAMALQPENIDDLAALIALYRPGPLGSGIDKLYIDKKHNRPTRMKIHPVLEDLLPDSYSLMIYQEDVLKVAREVAGFDPEEADTLRKTLSKKLLDKIGLFREKFVDGAKKHIGLPTNEAFSLFSDIEYFAGYGFSKNHAFSYAYITYQTAYLKTHYPIEYMTAILTSTATKRERLSRYLNECRRMGLSVLPPSINESFPEFVIKDDKTIRFGFDAIDGVGHEVAKSFVQSRQDKGDYSSVYDFFRKIHLDALKKSTIEHLARAGCFDDYVEPSSGTMSHDKKTELLNIERKELGLYVTEHPLDDIDYSIMNEVDCAIDELTDRPENSVVTIGGIIAEKNEKTTKSGNSMAILTVEDLSGEVEVVVFPNTYKKYDFEVGEIVYITGKLELEGDEDQPLAKLIFFNKTEVDLSKLDTGPRPEVIELPNRPTYEEVKRVYHFISKHPGDTRVQISFPDNHNNVTMEFNNTIDPQYLGDIVNVF